MQQPEATDNICRQGWKRPIIWHNKGVIGEIMSGGYMLPGAMYYVPCDIYKRLLRTPVAKRISIAYVFCGSTLGAYTKKYIN